MSKVKKISNPHSSGQNKILVKKNKNVPLKKSGVKEGSIKKLKSVSKETIAEPKIESVKPGKAITKKSISFRNTVEATTTSFRQKIVKKFKPPTLRNGIPTIHKKKLKFKDSQIGDGDKKQKAINSEKNVIPKRSKPKKRSSTTNNAIRNTKSPKESEMVPSLEEAPSFDQEHFKNIIKQDKIKKIIQVLNKLVKNETSRSKNLVFRDYKYNLNIACFKISSVPKRIVKLKVKHSLAEEDVLLIVKDLQRGSKVDHEPTNQHYEDLLKENGIDNIKTVMSFNQLKTEYSTFEMKRKLSNLYDYFLCDGAIVGHAVGFLGKIFSTKTRCTPYAVRLNNPKLIKTEIKKALHKTCFKQGQKGNLISIPVGTDKMTPGQVADNVLHIIDQLEKVYAGGFPNIRNMSVGTNIKGTSSLPIYINMGKPIEGTPYIIGPRELKLNKLKEKANKVLSQFEMTNNASMTRVIKEVNVQKRKRANGMDEDDDYLESISEESKKNIKKIKSEKSNEGTEDVESSDNDENEVDDNSSSSGDNEDDE